jgi:hypothetical protein
MPETMYPPEEFNENSRLTDNKPSDREEEENLVEPAKYTFTCGTLVVVIGFLLLTAGLIVVFCTDLLETPQPVTKMIEIKWKCPTDSSDRDCELTRKMTLMPIEIDVPFERHWLTYTQQYRLQKELANIDSNIMAQIDEYYKEMQAKLRRQRKTTTFVKETIKAYGIDSSRFPNSVKGSKLFNKDYWQQAKIRQIKKKDLVSGLDKAFTAQLTVASDDLYVKIGSFTDLRKSGHERLLTLIRARILRQDKSKGSAKDGETRSMYPKTTEEKAIVMKVLGQYKRGKSMAAVPTFTAEVDECCSAQVFKWERVEEREQRYNVMIRGKDGKY